MRPPVHPVPRDQLKTTSSSLLNRTLAVLREEHAELHLATAVVRNDADGADPLAVQGERADEEREIERCSVQLRHHEHELLPGCPSLTVTVRVSPGSKAPREGVHVDAVTRVDLDLALVAAQGVVQGIADGEIADPVAAEVLEDGHRETEPIRAAGPSYTWRRLPVAPENSRAVPMSEA